MAYSVGLFDGLVLLIARSGLWLWLNEAFFGYSMLSKLGDIE